MSDAEIWMRAFEAYAQIMSGREVYPNADASKVYADEILAAYKFRFDV